MNTTTLKHVFSLPIEERIQLVEMIWDSVALESESSVFVLTPDQKKEIMDRLAEFSANPHIGYSWEESKKMLKDGSWATL